MGCPFYLQKKRKCSTIGDVGIGPGNVWGRVTNREDKYEKENFVFCDEPCRNGIVISMRHTG